MLSPLSYQTMERATRFNVGSSRETIIHQSWYRREDGLAEFTVFGKQLHLGVCIVHVFSQPIYPVVNFFHGDGLIAPNLDAHVQIVSLINELLVDVPTKNDSAFTVQGGGFMYQQVIIMLVLFVVQGFVYPKLSVNFFKSRVLILGVGVAVVVTFYQNLATVQMAHQFLHLLGGFEKPNITNVVNEVVFSYPSVPTLYHGPIHLFHVFERTLRKPDDITVVEVVSGCRK